MADALGLLEARSFAAMVEGADAMVKAAKVDGKRLKADTYYELKGGKFVESK